MDKFEERRSARLNLCPQRPQIVPNIHDQGQPVPPFFPLFSPPPQLVPRIMVQIAGSAPAWAVTPLLFLFPFPFSHIGPIDRGGTGSLFFFSPFFPPPPPPPLITRSIRVNCALPDLIQIYYSETEIGFFSSFSFPSVGARPFIRGEQSSGRGDTLPKQPPFFFSFPSFPRYHKRKSRTCVSAKETGFFFFFFFFFPPSPPLPSLRRRGNMKSSVTLVDYLVPLFLSPFLVGALRTKPQIKP